MEEATEDKKTSPDEVGAFAFLSPPADDNEVSFVLYSNEEDKGNEPSDMTVEMVEGPSEDETMCVDLALVKYSDEDKENIDPSEMTVEMLGDDANIEDERIEASEGAVFHDARSESTDSIYYDVNDDDDLDSFFDEEDVLVSPPSATQVEPVIDLTKSSSPSDGETSRVARMPTAAERAEEERYARQQLLSDTSDDEVKLVPWKSEGNRDPKVPAMVYLTVDQEWDETRQKLMKIVTGRRLQWSIRRLIKKVMKQQ